MALPEIVTREEWLEARMRLLAIEKQESRRLAALNAERRRLPMVKVEKEYLFDGPDGRATLADMFGDCSQLIVDHVMFPADWEAACSGCSAGTEVVNDRLLAQLRSRDTALVMVSISPIDKLLAYRAAKGWAVPWYSSRGSDFNYDYQVTLDRKAGQLTYNYRSLADELTSDEPDERAGTSCFLRDGHDVYHTYSTYARGTELTTPAYAFLDLTAFGRSESWEEPAGRAHTLHGGAPVFND